MALDRTTPVYDPDVYGEPEYADVAWDVDVYGELTEAVAEGSASAGNAAGTGAAGNAAISIAPNAGAATGAGSAFDATISTAAAGNAQAELASGTGAAPGASVALAPNSGVGSGTGASGGPSSSVSVGGGLASGTGAAGDATGTAGAGGFAEAATGTGAASNAKTSIAPNAGNAAGTGIARTPTAKASVRAGAATGTGAAFGPATTTDTTASIGHAHGYGVAYNAVAGATSGAGGGGGGGGGGSGSGGFIQCATIRYEGVDITADVLISSARFTAQTNGNPGPASLKVRDDGHTYDFVSGGGLTVDINGIRMWGGYVTKALRVYPFDVEPTDTPSESNRYWQLQGVDYNVLFNKRIIFDESDPAGTLSFDYPVGTYDDTIILDIFHNYLDIADDDISPAGVERVNVVSLDIPGVTSGKGTLTDGRSQVAAAGYTWKQSMDVIARATGAVYYINPDKVFCYVDVDTADAGRDISDTPSGSDVGIQKFIVRQNGSNLVNDMLVWGAAPGVSTIVFSRSEDAASQTEHGVWQAGLFSQGLYKQASADLVADSFLYGTPQSKRGGKDDAVTVTGRVFEPVFRAGQKVGTTIDIFGYQDVLPIRRMDISFANPCEAIFDLTLSHEIDLPWSIFEMVFPAIGLPNIKPIVIPPFIPPVIDVLECDDTVCGITDDFSFPSSHVLTVPALGSDTDSGDLVSSGWPTGFSLFNDNNGATDLTISLVVEDGVMKQYRERGETFGEVDYYSLFAAAPLVPPYGLTVDFMIVDAPLQQQDDGFFEVFMGGSNQAQAYFVYNTGELSPTPVAPAIQLWYDDNAGSTIGDQTTMTLTEGVWYHLRMEATPGLEVKAWLWEDGDPEPSTPTLLIGTLGRAGWSFNDVTIFQFGGDPDEGPYEWWIRNLDIVGVDACSGNVFDSFSRTVSSGWGTTSSGYPWTNNSVSATVSVNGSEGLFSNLTGASSPQMDIASGPFTGDSWTMTCLVKWNAQPSSQSEIWWLAFDAFTLRIGVHDFGSGQYIFIEGTGGDDDLAFVSLPASAYYFVKAEFERGVQARAKVWSPGSTEPDWQVTAASPDSGTPGPFRVTVDWNGTPNGTIRFDSIDFDYEGKPCFPCSEGGTGTMFDDFERADDDEWGLASGYVSGSTSPYQWVSVDDDNGTYQGLVDLVNGAGRLYTPTFLIQDLSSLTPSVSITSSTVIGGSGSFSVRHRLKFAQQDTNIVATTPFWSGLYGRVGVVIETGATVNATTGRGLEVSVSGVSSAARRIPGFQLQTGEWYYIRVEQTLNVSSKVKIWLASQPEPASWTVVTAGPTSGSAQIQFFIESGSSTEGETVSAFEVFMDDLEYQVENIDCGQAAHEDIGPPVAGAVCENAERISSSLYRVSNAFKALSSRVYINGNIVRRGTLLDYTEDPPNGEIVFNGPEFPDVDDTVYVCYTANGSL